MMYQQPRPQAQPVNVAVPYTQFAQMQLKHQSHIQNPPSSSSSSTHQQQPLPYTHHPLQQQQQQQPIQPINARPIYTVAPGSTPLQQHQQVQQIYPVHPLTHISPSHNNVQQQQYYAPVSGVSTAPAVSAAHIKPTGTVAAGVVGVQTTAQQLRPQLATQASFTSQSQPHFNAGHAGSINANAQNISLPPGYVLGTPTILPAVPGFNVLSANGTIIRPPIVMRPPASISVGNAKIISSPGLARLPLVGNMRPILIAAGPPSIIKNPLRTKALLERPVPRIHIKQRTNTLLADFWSEDMDVTKDGKMVSIHERAKSSSEWKLRTPKQAGIVVGIDFGNTFTGVSYSHQNDGEMIDIVKWPKHLSAYAKVPTVSLYKTTEGKSLLDWGSSALSSYKRSKTDKVLIRDYKLQLFDQGARGRLEQGLYLTDVFTQYIRSVHQHLVEEVNKTQVLSAESIPMHYCITVPQAWTLPTRELVLRCYVEAGVILQTPAPNMTVITEAEAAATYCREHCIEFESLRDSDIFMICDAGGLTTHVTAFRVDDSLGVRQFVRLSSSHAEDCGSVMLDRRFKDLVLRRLTGLDIDAKPQRQKAFETLLEGFDEIKSQFDANAVDEVKHILVPMGLDVSELSPAPSWMEDEYMSLSGKELCEEVFDPVIQRIQNLIWEQSKVHPVCAVMFLVGGLGSNKYLYNKLVLAAIETEENPGAHVGKGMIQKFVMVQKAELAVARGAVIYGLKSAAQQSKAFL